MFKPLSSWFSSPLDNSKKSYSYSKNPSAIDWLAGVLISTIFKNIPFFNKTTNKKEARENTEQENEANDTTNKDDELEKLFLFHAQGMEFPKDYSHQLVQLHQMIPEIKFQHPNKAFDKRCTYSPVCYKRELEELKQPITSPSELIRMTKILLHFLELLENDCKHRYPVKQIEVLGDQEESQMIEYIPDAKIACSNLNAQSSNQSKISHMRNCYALALKSILQEPASLKNVILIVGLEYSVMVDMEFAGRHDVYTKTSNPTIPLSDRNSAKNFFHPASVDYSVIKVPLIHLAVEKGILPEVSFLLTKDNVNRKSYQCVNLDQNQYEDQELSLIILDIPVKIAIDNYDHEALDTLLQHEANLNIPIRPNLSSRKSKYASFTNRVPIVKPFTKLSDYFLTKTPAPGKETTSYIEMAKSIHHNLPEVECDGFINTAENKMITVKAEEESSTNEPQP